MTDEDSHYEQDPGVQPARIRPYPKRKSPVTRLPRESEVVLKRPAAENRTGPSYEQVLREHAVGDEESTA